MNEVCIEFAGDPDAFAGGKGAAGADRRARASITSSTVVFVLVRYLLTFRDGRQS